MYARPTPDGRFPRHMQVPHNYSGNAFRQEEPPEPQETVSSVDTLSSMADLPPAIRAAEEEREGEGREAASDSLPEETDEKTSVGRLFAPPGFRLDLNRFFKHGKGEGLGFEELLIMGLILLVAGGERKDDLVFLLFLLLFIE